MITTTAQLASQTAQPLVPTPQLPLEFSANFVDASPQIPAGPPLTKSPKIFRPASLALRPTIPRGPSARLSGGRVFLYLAVGERAVWAACNSLAALSFGRYLCKSR